MDKQTAIDLLDNLLGMVEDNHESDYDTAIKMGIDALKSNASNALSALDCVERQAAIDALGERPVVWNEWTDEYSLGQRNQYDTDKLAIETVPSVQPEIIRCKDCRWGREVCGNIECFVDSNLPPEYHGYEWFCPNGERRTDE